MSIDDGSACSGLMYVGVPTMAPVSPRLWSVRLASVALATPKSITLGVGRPSTSATITLQGFRSRWMIPFWCACCTAWQAATNRRSRAPTERRCRSQYSVIGTPRTNSMTKNGWPASVAPPS